MIRSFRHKGLKQLFTKGRTAKVAESLRNRCVIRLDALNQAERLGDLNVPGFNFHPLRGSPQRYSLHVNGPWCITFEWVDGEAWRVDLEQYH
jgi:proteic killer suppression protein